MKTTGMLLVLLTVLALTACQSGWVRLDGSKPTASELEKARNVCKVDEKLAALEEIRSADNAATPEVTSNQARMLRIENYELERTRVQRGIDDCMQAEGMRAS